MTAEEPFPEGFLWGAATSAYQIEGAASEDGRRPSIWDTFSHTPGNTLGGDTGDVACDHYHRFEEDADLVADLGLDAFRFSISWSRVFPDGRGPVNRRGLDHYRRVVDALLARGIAPVVNLFHWDLPQALENDGGWTSRDTAEHFAEYAATVHDALAPDVRLWITMNEPWVAAWLGYAEGVHAPGRRDLRAALAASHHLLLAHGLAVRAMDEPEIGIVLNLEPHRPARDHPDDERAARLGGQHMNEQFLGPVFGHGYPDDLMAHYGDVREADLVHEGDLETIAQPIGFLGINYYRPQMVTADPETPGVTEPVVGSLGSWYVIPSGTPVTAMNWPIDPSGLTELFAWVGERYAPSRIYITENGAAFHEAPGTTGVIEDLDRIAYLSGHLGAVRAAIAAGSPVEGYLVWSLLDNFEWAYGYSKTFGIVHVDLATQRRTPKASALWYAEVVRTRGRAIAPRTPLEGNGEREPG